MAARWGCWIGLHDWELRGDPGKQEWVCKRCDKPPRPVATPISATFADSIDAGELLWEEYKYRHDLVWRLVFQLTTAVILINTAPYLKDNVTKGIGWPMLAVPALAIALALLGVSRLAGSTRCLTRCARATSSCTATLPSRGTFKRQSVFYLWCLVALSVVNLVALGFLWLPDAK